jgi:hypothetical protein
LEYIPEDMDPHSASGLVDYWEELDENAADGATEEANGETASLIRIRM